MASSNEKVIPKRRPGRPATGKDPVVTVRLPVETIKSLDAKANADGLTRSDLIRRLVELGLKAKGKR
jgi:hypothetical protein